MYLVRQIANYRLFYRQFSPLLYEIFSKTWFENGCISAHYLNMAVEGEEVRAFVELPEKAKVLIPITRKRLRD